MGRLALLSVSDKTGVVEFARQLVEQFEFELISSGGTAKTLAAAGIPVIPVSEYTGSPEILGGRVKTLHPRIHGGILARRDLESDIGQLEANNIRPIDLVVVNLYPFEQTIAQPDCSIAQATEQIDIGGPTLIRAAAKNYAHVTVLCDPKLYGQYIEQLGQGITAEFRQQLAGLAFAHTCAYDRAISDYFARLNQTDTFSLSGGAVQTLRYGENPHQSATWYQTGNEGWAAAEKLQGKELSYNNLVDLEAAREIIAEFVDSKPTVAILKHTNPCGVAMADSPVEAYSKALAADAVSAFGGIVALNRPIDRETATELTQTFLECVIAPGCSEEAKEVIGKKSKLRVLIFPDLSVGSPYTVKMIAGGFLVQQSDTALTLPADWQIVTSQQPDESQLEELLFAWKVVKHVKSNAIVVTKDGATLGIGAGQMNRVGSVKIALNRVGEEATGGVLASDGFFPFDDSVRTAAAAGISAIIQPGGSIRDQDSIAAADELGITMVFTGMRHFLH